MARRASSVRSSTVSTVPVGLCGELTSTSRVRGPKAARRASRSRTKAPDSPSRTRPTVTSRAPAPRQRSRSTARSPAPRRPARVVTVGLVRDGESGAFVLDRDALRAAFGPRTRLVLVNSPHNPTGTVLTVDDLTELARLAIAGDVVVVTDEVYEHLTFDGVAHVPIATLPGMAERTLSISSAGKTLSFTGWKIGWVTGPADEMLR